MADEENLYDEFGNYIGPELSSSSSSSSSFSDDDDESSERMTMTDDDYEDDEDNRGGFTGISDDEDDEDKSSKQASEISSRAIVLHEDKKYYPNAEEVYGDDVEIHIEEEDRQSLETPIIQPKIQKTFLKASKTSTQLSTTDSTDATPTKDDQTTYITDLITHTPDRIRNIAIVGNLGHGKTKFVDMLFAHAKAGPPSLITSSVTSPSNSGLTRFTDVRKDEQEMELSLKSSAMTLLMSDSTGENFVMNIVDTPGHPNFADEVSASLRLSDGVVVVVDACEGVMMQTERLIRLAVREKQPIVLVLNKIDRLILDLHLPPPDAYHKIRYIIESVNGIIDSLGVGVDQSRENAFLTERVSPELGNVLFASGEHGWCFSIPTFARIYTDRYYKSDHCTALSRRQAMLGLNPSVPFITKNSNENNNNDNNDTFESKINSEKVNPSSVSSSVSAEFTAEEFGSRLWGDVYFNARTRSFQDKEPERDTGSSGYRTFVEFVLEPIYKIYSAILGEDEQTVKRVLRRGLGIHIRRRELRQDVTPLIKTAMARFLSHTSGFVDMVSHFIPSPRAAAHVKTLLTFPAPQGSFYSSAAAACDSAGPLLINVTKLCPTPDGGHFRALGRVFAGTLAAGDRVRVLGEAYSPLDEEDSGVATVARVLLPAGRDEVEVRSVGAGALVLVEGVDELIVKSGTIVSEGEDEQPYAFVPIRFDTCSVMKVAVEPLVPAELPKMLDGLRKINKAYPLCVTKKEESGEHTIIGTGELYLDAVLRDLREVYTGIEIKVSDPVVSFCETVLETSAMCSATSQNGLNTVSMIAEPLEKGLAEAVENKEIAVDADRRRIARFMEKFGWRANAAMSLWAFGPETQGPNAIIDECFAEEIEKKNAIESVKRFIVQGFQWATREGPLCEERKKINKQNYNYHSNINYFYFYFSNQRGKIQIG